MLEQKKYEHRKNISSRHLYAEVEASIQQIRKLNLVLQAPLSTLLTFELAPIKIQGQELSRSALKTKTARKTAALASAFQNRQPPNKTSLITA